MAYVYPLSGGLPISDKDLMSAWDKATQMARQVAQQSPAQQPQQQQPQQQQPQQQQPPPQTLVNIPGLPSGGTDYTPLLLLGGGLGLAYFLSKKK